MNASSVYVRAWALGCFYSHISTRTFRRALTASLDRVWRKVPESDARSVDEDAGKPSRRGTADSERGH